LVKNFNTGNFLKIEHITKAYELICLQMEDPKFSFKTLELEIYRLSDQMKGFDCEKFYNELLVKDNFYNKGNIFFNIDYLIPKGTYGVREFNFLSLELLILYYSLGFYIHDLIKESYETIENKKTKRDNISTYYGGKIDFNSPKKSDLYYQTDYINFNNQVNDKIQEILNHGKKVVVIKLDIQDYFKTIDLEILLKIIKKYSVPSNSKKLNLDYATLEELKNLFLFINKSLKGIPLFSQNIISNFLSYIYLFDLDNYIQELSISHEKDFLYCRYVDDFYLIFKKNKTIKNDEIGDEIFQITTGITEFLYTNLQLNINQLKTHKLIIEDKSDFEQFIKKEKIISIPDTLKKEKKPKEKLEEIKEIIDKLKRQYKLKGNAYLDIEENNKLKEIFSTTLKKYLLSRDAIDIVDKIFKGWNPILTLSNSQALIFLIKHSSENILLKNFLLEKKEIKFNSPQYLFLLEKYILSNSKDDEFAKTILASTVNNSYFNLIKKMLDNKIVLVKNDDIAIDDLFLDINDTVMQQIKMLTLAEMEGKFNLAFNHLLNIYHYYCFKKDSNNTAELKKYNQNNVLDFLDHLKIPIEYLNFSIQFFDRRNKNNISHPGEELLENWVVNKQEYFEFKIKLNNILKKINELTPPTVKPFLF